MTHSLYCMTFLLIAIFSLPTYGDTLFTKTHNGTVSLNIGLTAHECDIARKQALGEPISPAQIKAAKKAIREMLADQGKWRADHPCNDPSTECPASPGDTWYIVSGSDIEQAECLK